MYVAGRTGWGIKAQSGEMSQGDMFGGAAFEDWRRAAEKTSEYRAQKAAEYGKVAEVLRIAMSRKAKGKLNLDKAYAKELGINDASSREQLAAARDKAVERKRYWKSAPALKQADMDAMLSALGIAPETMQGAQNRAEAAVEGAGAREAAQTNEDAPAAQNAPKAKNPATAAKPAEVKPKAKPTEKEKVAAKKAELALKAATADELQTQREQQRQKAEMKRRQDAPVHLRGERKGMAETGQSLMDLGGAEGEDLFNRTVRTEEKDTKPTEKEKVAARKGVDAQGNPVGADGKLKLEAVESVDELTDADFTKPTRNVRLPKIPANIDAAIGADGKPVIIKRNIFEKNAEHHKELSAAKGRSILQKSLYNPNLVGQSQPITQPNYKVAIQTGDKNAVTIIDVAKTKDNVEVVGWREIDAKGFERLQKQAAKEGGRFLILHPSEEGQPVALSGRQSGSSGNSISNPAESRKPAKSGADSAAETSATGGDTARSRLEAAYEDWAGEKPPKWADGLDEAHTAEYARLVAAASKEWDETKNPGAAKDALDRFEESHGRSFRPAAAKSQAKPTEKERVAAKKAEVAEKKARQAAGVVFRNGDDVALVQDGERVTGKAMRSPDGTLAVRVKEKVARSAAHPDGVQVRDVPVKDKTKLVKLIDNGGMRFKRGKNADLRSQIDAVLNTDRKAGEVSKRRTVVKMSRVPASLVRLGLPDAEIETRADIVRKIHTQHGLSAAQIADIPARIDSPAAVLKDGKDFIVLTDLEAKTKHGENKPVMVLLRPWRNADGSIVFLASAYPREAANENKYINIAQVRGNTLFVDKNKIAAIGLEERTISTLNTPTSRGVSTDSVSQTAARSQIGREAPRGVQKSAGVEYPDAGREISGLRFKVGAKRREEYARQLAKHRPDLDANAVLDEIDKFDEPKKEKAALHWVVRGAIRLPEDAYKVEDALSVAEKAKVDPFAYKSPLELIEAHKDIKPTRRAIDPETVPELSDRRDEGDGIVSYEVADIREGQAAMRRIIDTHWGEDANPWCLLARGDDASPEVMRAAANLYPGDPDAQYAYIERQKKRDDGLARAWEYWNHYSALPKRVAFKDGRLLAFMATEGDYAVKSWRKAIQEGRDNADKLEELGNRIRSGEPLPERDEILNELDVFLMATDVAGVLSDDADELRDRISGWYSGDAENPIVTEEDRELFDEALDAAILKLRNDADEAEYENLQNIPEQWWDRKDESHPDLDWARGGASGLRFKVGGVYTGSAADYANRSRHGGVDDGPSIKHIGTDEGSNVYGWGLYGSTVRGVAEGYANPSGKISEVLVNGERHKAVGVYADVADFLQSGDTENFIKDTKNALDEMQHALDDSGKTSIQYGFRRIDQRYIDNRRANLEEAQRIINDGATLARPGNLYEQTWFTNRAEGDESHLLKWYEPVSEEQLEWIKAQAEKEGWNVKREDGGIALIPPAEIRFSNANVFLPDGRMLNGKDIYGRTSTAIKSPQAASEFLARAGIDGIKYPVNSYGKTVKDGDKAGWNYVAFSDEHIRVDHKWTDGQMRFKRGDNERAADDTSVWFGAGASMAAHGFDVHTAKELGLNITDKDTVAAARALAADVRRMAEIETFALTSNRPLAAEEVVALAILIKNLDADLGRINQTMAESANPAAFQAEKELVETRLNKAYDALEHTSSRSGQSQRSLRVSVPDDVRDSEIYILRSIQAERRKQGAADDDAADTFREGTCALHHSLLSVRHVDRIRSSRRNLCAISAA